MAAPVLIGEAVLDPTVLVDSLVPDVIDGLRDSLQPAFGIRAYRAYRVIRTWSGKVAGEGTPSDVTHELRPYPKVMVWNERHYEQATAGVRDLGEVRLSEISLTYTEQQLRPKVGKNVEVYIGLIDANGQGTAGRLFGHTQPPFVDREQSMGWMVYLRVADGAPPWAP